MDDSGRFSPLWHVCTGHWRRLFFAWLFNRSSQGEGAPTDSRVAGPQVARLDRHSLAHVGTHSIVSKESWNGYLDYLDPTLGSRHLPQVWRCRSSDRHGKSLGWKKSDTGWSLRIEPMGFDWKIGIGLVASFGSQGVFVSTMSIIYSVEDSEDIKPLRNRLRSEKRPDGTPVYTPRVCLSLMVFYVSAA